MSRSDSRCIAVVVTYNKLDLLKECLHQLILCHKYLYKIVVVNNASTDDTRVYLEKLTEEQPMLDVVNEKTNLGGATGFNHGMKRAMFLGADTIWVMDNDCIVSEQTIVPLMDARRDLELDGIEWGFWPVMFAGQMVVLL